MSSFFIRRPIFAIVISIIIVILGALSLLSLPIAQYPQISPPTVNLSTTYTGANATIVNPGPGRSRFYRRYFCFFQSPRFHHQYADPVRHGLGHRPGRRRRYRRH